jgi:DNA-binding MarR family transcriptional regulator
MNFVYYLKFIPEINKDDINESSVKILEALIEHKEPLSTKELVKICNISSRMIQYNLERMLNNNPPLVRKAPDLKDMRKKRYVISPDLNEKVNNIKNLSNLSNNSLNR